MFDARYHALSLVAVFLALIVGLLLGVAIGDAGLVSGAEKSLRKTLRGDVREAQRERDTARDQVALGLRYQRESYPLLVTGRLTDRRVGLLFLGKSSASLASDVRDALTDSGGKLTGTLALKVPADLGALAGAAGPTRYTDLERTPALLEPFARRIGAQLIAPGGKLLRREKQVLFPTRAGAIGPFDVVVVVRLPPTIEDATQRATTATLEDGIVRGMTESGAVAVGVEPTATSPSSVSWFRARNLATVDDMGDIAGAAALVFALGGAQGSFGTGPLASSLLPDVASITPR